MPRAALTCGCFYQSLPSVPSQSIDDALSELRSYMSTPRRQSFCGAFSCIARSCRRFHDAVHPASMNRDTMLRQTSSPRRLGAGPEGGAGTTAGSLSTPSSAPRRDLSEPSSIGVEDFAVQGHDALLRVQPQRLQPPPPTPIPRLQMWIQQVKLWQDSGCSPCLAWRIIGILATPAIVCTPAEFVAEASLTNLCLRSCHGHARGLLLPRLSSTS